MATLTVRNLDDAIAKQLRIRAAEHGRSAEAEHREILRAALIAGQPSLARQQAAQGIASGTYEGLPVDRARRAIACDRAPLTTAKARPSSAPC